MRLSAMNDALFFCFMSLGITIAMYVDILVYNTYVLYMFPVFVAAFVVGVVGFIWSMQDVLKSINNGGVRTQ